MRWSIVQVIWMRELRDQLRDRRTILMIAVLPVLIYPLGGMGLMQLATGFLNQRYTVGLCGAEHLPPGTIRTSEHPARASAMNLVLTPLSPSTSGSVASLATALALAQREQMNPPLLVQREDGSARFLPGYFENAREADSLVVHLYPRPLQSLDEPLSAVDRAPLDSHQVDILLVIPGNFEELLDEERRPTVLLLSRQGDDRSRMANNRLASVLNRWKERLKEARFLRHQLPPTFDEPITIKDPEREKSGAHRASEDLFDLLIRIFPFVLVLWSLAGALYPAVDLCAGEKERGTMETLLITPASREEIVWGKFLAIWVFSGATACLNLASMSVTTWQFSTQLAHDPLPMLAFVWCLVLILPLSAFFSALCLAIGAYARSSKEGQYYLMPLFLLTMPLIFLTLAPGVQLNPFYSMVPVTGVALLLQKLMTVGKPDPTLWLYFIPVLAPMIIYSWLALRWAIDQFNREEVLFREAERLDLGLWLRQMLRQKEARPSTAEALFCFAVMLLLRWFTLGMGQELLVTHLITMLAFVAAPALIMAFTLTTQPRQSLALRLPPLWAWPAAVGLVVLLLPPLLEVTRLILEQFPALVALIQENRPLHQWSTALRQEGTSDTARRWLALTIFAWIPALCEELAFRGLILTGLQRRYRPRTAVLLSSFLFALLHMNVFQFIPTFLLGVVLASLTTRCGSIFPSILFHALYNTFLLAPTLFLGGSNDLGFFDVAPEWRWLLAGVTAPLGAALMLWLARLRPHPAYVAFLRSDPGLQPVGTWSARQEPSVRETAS